MATKQEEKPESQAIFEPYLQEIKRLQRENKGLKGQNSLLRKKQAPENPKQVESGQPESDSSHSEPAQAEPAHLARPWEKVCLDCGGENPNFKGPPNVFCGAKGCDGKIPMGHVELGDIKKLEGGRVEFPGVGKCFNCGKDDSAKLVLE